MPRIPPWLHRRARRHSPNTVALLPACRSLDSAANELRWIREHVETSVRDTRRAALEVARLCKRRGQGVPLQYILGSQPFGPLDIKCTRGVLIPRPETEAYACHLAHLIRSGKLSGALAGGQPGQALNIVDFCTGTGCIPMLLFSALQGHVADLNVVGVDVSPLAVKLARENIARNVRRGGISPLLPGQTLAMIEGDVFQDSDIEDLSKRQWHVMVANPPYIASRVWNYGLGNLGYSVRKYEPPLALVPSRNLPVPPGWTHEDVFYSRLLDVAGRLRSRLILLEVGDAAQARRVVEGIFRHRSLGPLRVEIWRDWPDLAPEDGEEESMRIVCDGGTRDVPVKGSGQVRSIWISVEAGHLDDK